jgi:parallel beta-helix repeat protein
MKLYFSNTFPSAKSLFLFFGVIIISTALNGQITCAGETLDPSCLSSSNQFYQCIDGDFEAPSLYGTKLLPPAQAENLPQFLIIKGLLTFTENYTFAPGSEIVFLDNNSGFRVFSTYELRLSSSYLHGCSRLWAGIDVRNSARISIQDCTIEDAKAGIILRNQSSILASGNVFRKNVCGILALSQTAGSISKISIILSSKLGISGNQFWGNNELLESISPSAISLGINSSTSPGTTAYPWCGIFLQRVNFITIGSLWDYPGTPVNSFLDFGQNKESDIRTNGIFAFNSNVTIKNSIFSNIGKYALSGGVAAEAISIQNTDISITNATIVGMNQNAALAPFNTFANCWQDIRAIGSNLIVHDVTSYKAGNSIQGFAQFNQNAVKFKI